MDIEEVRKIASEEMTKAVMNNIDSSLVFSYVKGLEEKLDKKDKIINAMANAIKKTDIGEKDICRRYSSNRCFNCLDSKCIIEDFSKNV